MKSKKLLKIASVAVLASTLAACGKEKVTKKDYEKWAKDNGYVLESDYDGWVENPDYEGWAEDNGYVRPAVENTLPKLEVSFSETYTTLDANILAQKIARKETLVFFWGSSTCNSCAAFKTPVNAFVKETGYSFYYLQDDDAVNTDLYLETLKETLGFQATAQITTPTVFVITNGELKKQWIAPTVTSSTEIKEYLDDYVNIDDAGSFVTAERKDLKTLEDLVVSVASGKKFILLTSRYACPHCNRLSDPNRDDVVTKIAQLWTGNFYKTTSENVAATIDMTKVDTTSSDSIFVGLNSTRVAELLTYIITTGEIAPEDLGVTFTNAEKTTYTFNADTFYAALKTYSDSDEGRQFIKGRMLNDIKFVPTFEAVNFSANVGVVDNAGTKTVVFENVVAQTMVQEGANISPTWKVDENGKAYVTYGKTGDAADLDNIASLRYSYFAKMLNGATSPTDGMNNSGSTTATGMLNNEYSVAKAWNKIANWLMSWAPQLKADYTAKYYDISATAEYNASQVTLTSYNH